MEGECLGNYTFSPRTWREHPEYKLIIMDLFQLSEACDVKEN